MNMLAHSEKKNRWNRNDTILLAFQTAVFAVLFVTFNDRLPDVVGSHYNMAGEQDGTMPKWGFWLLTAGLTIGLPVLMKVMRFVDPRSDNYARFQGSFELMRWVIGLFMQGITLSMIYDNLGYSLPLNNLLLGGIGVLMAVVGNRLGQLRSNFFLGIRTPWTLADENNWKRTHRFGARLWVAAGLVMFVSSWFVSGTGAVAVLLICAAGSGASTVAYSYMLFRRQQTTGK